MVNIYLLNGEYLQLSIIYSNPFPSSISSPCWMVDRLTQRRPGQGIIDVLDKVRPGPREIATRWTWPLNGEDDVIYPAW